MSCSGFIEMMRKRKEAEHRLVKKEQCLDVQLDLLEHTCENCGRNRHVRCSFLRSNGLKSVDGCVSWEP